MKPTTERIALLNHGQAETKNLMEMLAVDLPFLMVRVLPGLKVGEIPLNYGITKRLPWIAQLVHDQHGFSVFEELKTHPTDMARSVACYLLGMQPLSWQEKLELIHPLADDPHSGVREWAWLALRPYLTPFHMEALRPLEAWVHHPSERIRRFASEITRPRGVWCTHIAALRKAPWQAQDLLEPLKGDPAKYVQLSVANWLNDASKDHPNWVREMCHTWLQVSPIVPTQKICKRALRTIRSQS